MRNFGGDFGVLEYNTKIPTEKEAAPPPSKEDMPSPAQGEKDLSQETLPAKEMTDKEKANTVAY